MSGVQGSRGVVARLAGVRPVRTRSVDWRRRLKERWRPESVLLDHAVGVSYGVTAPPSRYGGGVGIGSMA